MELSLNTTVATIVYTVIDDSYTCRLSKYDILTVANTVLPYLISPNLDDIKICRLCHNCRQYYITMTTMTNVVNINIEDTYDYRK